MQKIYRFIEIDFQYLRLPLGVIRKLLDIFRTNTRLALNLMTQQTPPYTPVAVGGNIIYYDTPFATKTLLTTIYDFYIETKLATLLPEKPVVIDVGANIGQFIVAIKTFYPNAYIFSCEPDSDVYELLKKNASNFSNVKTYNYGLSHKDGRAAFYKSNDFSEWSGLKPLEGHSYEKTMVNLKKGDNLFKTMKKIDLLKIDVEGAELEVLEGLKETLKKCRYILIEASILRNPSDPGSKDMLTFLFKENFSINHVGRIFSDSTGKYQGACDLLLKNNNV